MQSIVCLALFLLSRTRSKIESGLLSIYFYNFITSKHNFYFHMHSNTLYSTKLLSNQINMQQQQTNPALEDEQIMNHMQSSKNRNCFVFPNSQIVIDSCFPSGNLGEVKMLSENTFEIRGNSDIQNDPFSKYWFYFRVRKVPVNMKIKFILKDLNSLRKLANKQKDRRMRPYIVYNNGNRWQPLYPEFITTNQKIERIGAEFTIKFKASTTAQTKQYFKNKKQKQANNIYSKQYYFALNYPYTINDQNLMIKNFKTKAENADSIYFNNQVLCQSVEGRNINLLTITSISNIQDFQQKQPAFHPKLFPNKSTRPLRLKQQVPVIILTARVHPSQVSGSFFLQGFVKFLCLQNNQASKLLRQMFIFYIVPMLNPDGVENGNFRFDNQSRNLNRFYGFSDFQSTPTIRAVQEIFIHLNGSQKKNQKRRRVALYFDIHGHNSPKPSFIFGNHTSNLTHATQNRLFCKLLELVAPKGAFSYSDCQFSQGNMKLKQKYDHYSKQGSGRVFVGKKVGKVIEERERQDFNSQSDQQQQQENKDKVENQNTQKQNIQHSYTLQICPYYSSVSIRKPNQLKQNTQNNTSFYSPTKSQLPDYCEQLAKSLCMVILQILNVNPIPLGSCFGKSQSIYTMRENVYQQLQRSQKVKSRINQPIPRNSQKTGISNKQKSIQNEIRCSQNLISLSKHQCKNEPGIGACEINQLIDEEYFQKWFSNSDYIFCLQKKNFKWRNQKLKKFIQKVRNFNVKRQQLKNTKLKSIALSQYYKRERINTQVNNIQSKKSQDICRNQNPKGRQVKNIFAQNKYKKQLHTIEGCMNVNQSQKYFESQYEQFDQNYFDKITVKKTLRNQHRNIKKKIQGNLKQITLNPDFEKVDNHSSSICKGQPDNLGRKFKTQKIDSYQLSRSNNAKSGLCHNINEAIIWDQQKHSEIILSQRKDQCPTNNKFKKSYTEVCQDKHPYLQKPFKRKRNEEYQKKSSIRRAQQQKSMMYYQCASQQTNCLKEIMDKMKNMQKIKGQNFVTLNVANQQIWKRTMTEGKNRIQFQTGPVFKVKLHNRTHSSQLQQLLENGKQIYIDNSNKQHTFIGFSNQKQAKKFPSKTNKKQQVRKNRNLYILESQQECNNKKQLRQLCLEEKNKQKSSQIGSHNFSRDRIVQLKRMNRLLQIREKTQKDKLAKY